MSGIIEARLRDLDIDLGDPIPPVANYVPAIRAGRLIFIAGQIAFGSNGEISPTHRGKLGNEVDIARGREAARVCCINVLGQLRREIGDLDAVRRCVRLAGYINVIPTFDSLPIVMNGASDLMIEVFGDKGRHARTTVGVAQLPLDSAVEVDAVFETD